MKRTISITVVSAGKPVSASVVVEAPSKRRAEQRDMAVRVEEWLRAALAPAVNEALTRPPASEKTLVGEIGNRWSERFGYQEVSSETVRTFECGGVTWWVTHTTGTPRYAAEVVVVPVTRVDWERVLAA